MIKEPCLQAGGPDSCSAIAFERCQWCTLSGMTIHSSSCFGFYEAFCTSTIYRCGVAFYKDTHVLIMAQLCICKLYLSRSSVCGLQQQEEHHHALDRAIAAQGASAATLD
jgi:hypothetical protein